MRGFSRLSFASRSTIEAVAALLQHFEYHDILIYSLYMSLANIGFLVFSYIVFVLAPPRSVVRLSLCKPIEDLCRLN